MKAPRYQKLRQWGKPPPRIHKPAREQPRAAAGVLIVLEPSTGKQARVVLGNTGGKLSDFGGNQEPRDQSLWAAAQRECMEESGFRPEAHHGSIDLQNKLGKSYTVFVATMSEASLESKLKPGSWVVKEVAVLSQRPDNLHPRLRYAPGRATKQLVEICKRVGGGDPSSTFIGDFDIVIEPKPN